MRDRPKEPDVQIMSPTQQPVVVKRKISYIAQDQAFTAIRLGKDYLKEFTFLREKVSDYEFFCLMKLHRKFEELKKEIDALEKKGLMPVLCFISKERKVEQ